MYVNVNVLQVSSCNFSSPRIYFLFTTELGREHLLDKQAGNLQSVHGHMHVYCVPVPVLGCAWCTCTWEQGVF